MVDDEFNEYYDEGMFEIFFSNAAGDNYTVEIDDAGIIKDDEGSLTYIITKQ